MIGRGLDVYKCDWSRFGCHSTRSYSTLLLNPNLVILGQKYRDYVKINRTFRSYLNIKRLSLQGVMTTPMHLRGIQT